MNKIIFLILGIAIGIIGFGIFYAYSIPLESGTSQEVLLNQIDNLNKEENRLNEENGCLSRVSTEMQEGMNYCLGFGSCPTGGGLDATSEEVDLCRDCLWKVYNYGAIERNKCYGYKDITKGLPQTFGLCDFGWGINGNANFPSPEERSQLRCN